MSVARRVLVVATIVAVIAAVAVLAVSRRGRDSGAPPATEAPSTTTAPTTVAPSPTTAVPPTTVPVDTTVAVFPRETGPHYDDPVEVARAFAIDFVGFVDPVLGRYEATGADAGAVEVRPPTSGPVTTVFVRQMGDSWWVTGAETPNVQLRSPSAMATISSPVRLQGTSTAFEANVSVEVRQDGARRPLGQWYVMGGANGEMGPFDGTIVFAEPTADMGALVLYTASMENGNVWEATVVRVRLAATAPLVPARACPDYSMVRPQPGEGQMVVTAFFSCDVDGAPVPTYRLEPASSAVLRAALEQTLSGPTPSERSAGLVSWFSEATSGMLEDVTITAGQAVVDFGDLRPVIPGASSSAGSRLLLSQLDATVFQFASVKSVIYRIHGDCAAFDEWLQLAGCEPRTRTP